MQEEKRSMYTKNVNAAVCLLNKQAGAGAEAGLSLITPAVALTTAGYALKDRNISPVDINRAIATVNAAAAPISVGASLSGLLGSGDDERAAEALRRMEKTPEMALTPFNASYRANRRVRLVAKALKGRNKFIHEALSSISPQKSRQPKKTTAHGRTGLFRV